jgi:hypothetical protein
MKRLILIAVVTLLSFSVFADDTPSGSLVVDDPTASEWCDASSCGDLPPAPGEPGAPPIGSGGGTAPEVCIQPSDFNTCIESCYCAWRNNKKKCNNGRVCLSMALSERNACFGNCIADWS